MQGQNEKLGTGIGLDKPRPEGAWLCVLSDRRVSYFSSPTLDEQGRVQVAGECSGPHGATKGNSFLVSKPRGLDLRCRCPVAELEQKCRPCVDLMSRNQEVDVEVCPQMRLSVTGCHSRAFEKNWGRLQAALGYRVCDALALAIQHAGPVRRLAPITLNSLCRYSRKLQRSGINRMRCQAAYCMKPHEMSEGTCNARVKPAHLASSD